MPLPSPIKRTALIVLLFLAMAHLGVAQTALPIPGVAPLYPLQPAGGGVPKAGMRYRIVFDLNSVAHSAGDPNPGLAVIAGLVNTYAQYGVGRERRRFVVVLRNDFVVLAENDSTYRQHHAGSANPDAALMQQLVRAGVVIAADAASLRKASLAQTDLQKGVQVHVSANLTFLDLEAEGYVYTSTRSLQ